MFNKKQFRILLLALLALLIVGSIYFAVKNKNQGGSDPETMAFTTEAPSESLTETDSAATSESTESQKESETPAKEDESEESSSSEEAPPAESEETSESTEGTTAELTTEKAAEETTEEAAEDPELSVSEDGEYTDKERVALYIYTYGHLPDNYITKDEAEDLGWISSRGNLGKVAPGKSIGGDRFGNYEKLLPTKKGRKYYECDIDFDGTYRNEKRIVFSNDGLIYYTDDHYESFEQLY